MSLLPSRRSTFTEVYALLNDGTVRAWGYNASGELGNGTTANSSTPVQVAGLAGVKEVGLSGITSLQQ